MVTATDKMPFSYHLLLSFNSINFFKYTSIECFIGKGKPARFIFFMDLKSNRMRTMWPNDCCYPSPTDALIDLKFWRQLSCFVPVWPWLHALSDIHKHIDLVEVHVFVKGRAQNSWRRYRIPGTSQSLGAQRASGCGRPARQTGTCCGAEVQAGAHLKRWMIWSSPAPRTQM